MHPRSRVRRHRCVCCVAVGAAQPARLAASDPGTGDWPMWGGTPDRNMVSNMKGLPTEWDVKTKKNVKWVAELGSQSYGNPVVAGGMVFVGTNNEALRDPKQPGDRGVLMAFRESNGEFLWQQTHEKLAVGPRQRLAVPGRRLARRSSRATQLYYVSNRGVVWCLDINGFRDGKNDGPVTDEKLTGPVRRRRHLVVRHDGGGRLLSAQHVELVAGHLRRSGLRQHVERPGREPRPHPVAARRRRSSRSTRTPASWCGKTTRSRTASCTASGRRRRSARSAASIRSSARRATAGCAATRR